MKTTTIGVIGAGVMGQGVAYQFAKSGYNVTLIDISEDILEKARREIRNITRHDMLFNKPAQPINVSDAITYATELHSLSDHAFIVENTTENTDIKKAVYQDLHKVIGNETIVAANTSAVSITKLGGMLPEPRNVLGIHFMNPVHMKPTVEVIRGHHTSDKTIDTALGYLDSVGIAGVVVQDYPGFVSNRVLMLTVNEAIFTLQDGVATVADIDKIFRECFGHKMGPLETADLIGLDTILYTLEVLFESYNDPKFRPAPLLRKMVDAHLHGRKSGEGFYSYSS